MPDLLWANQSIVLSSAVYQDTYASQVPRSFENNNRHGAEHHNALNGVCIDHALDSALILGLQQ